MSFIVEINFTRLLNFLHVGAGHLTRCPESHTAVVHGTDQRREMGTAHNPAGCAVGVPVAFKRYSVGGSFRCGLRAGRSRLRAEYDGDKEEKARYDAPRTAKDAGEAR